MASAAAGRGRSVAATAPGRSNMAASTATLALARPGRAVTVSGLGPRLGPVKHAARDPAFAAAQALQLPCIAALPYPTSPPASPSYNSPPLASSLHCSERSPPNLAPTPRSKRSTHQATDCKQPAGSAFGVRG